MHYADKARDIYREGGTGAVAKAVANKIGRRRKRPVAYQEKVAAGHEQRRAMIDATIPLGASSVLDLGSNLGDMTAACARRGMWSIGVEVGADLVAQARNRHADVQRCGFVLMDVSPDTIDLIPPST